MKMDILHLTRISLVFFFFFFSFKRQTVVLSLFHTVLSNSNTTAQNLSSIQYDFLFDLYTSTNGPFWRWKTDTSPPTIPWDFTTYNTSAPCYNWQGVFCHCDTSTCAIEQLVLTAHNLTGPIPPTISNLSSVLIVNLDHNTLNGSLPFSLFTIPTLYHLDLSSNSLNGSLPNNLGDVKALSYFNLGRNHFSGLIPSSFFSLSSLEYVELEINEFAGFASPVNFTNLSHLSILDLSLNRFHGTIPESLYSLSSSLYSINLNYNLFTGTLSSSIGNLINLDSFTIADNRLNGSLPSSIGLLTSLTSLSLMENHFSQSLPKEIGNLLSLTLLDLDHNRFTGNLPENLGNLTKLQFFLANNNSFFGSFPSSFANKLTREMLWISLTNNLLSKTLPESLSEWLILKNLEFDRNSFTGTIPSSFSSFQFLLGIQLTNNFFFGENIFSLFSLNNTRLELFELGNNLFSGILPNSNHWLVLKWYLMFNNYFIGNITNLLFLNSLNQENLEKNELYYLDCSQNYLSFTIPSFFSSIYALTYFNLSFNLFTGTLNYTLPSSLSSVGLHANLEEYSVNDNFLTGSIPSDLGMLPNLIDLILNDNNLIGSIPSSFLSLPKLEILFLQNNQFTGILDNLVLSSLINIDLSNNQFVGTIPSFSFSSMDSFSALQTFTASSNCLHGSVPSSFCEIPFLTTLVLDGVSTASSCRIFTFPNSPFLNAFYVKFFISDNIPSCLFSIPNLQTLHLSGNGLTGSFPFSSSDDDDTSSAAISSSLSDLSLSHNQLTGTIPLSIQERSWINLDLSYNKLTGTLSSSFSSYDSESSLSLDINRLSGDIPSSLLSASNINILAGNMFECDSSHDDLPSHDSKVNDYSCGSDVVNASIYTWISLIACFVCCCFCFQYHDTLYDYWFGLCRCCRFIFLSSTLAKKDETAEDTVPVRKQMDPLSLLFYFSRLQMYRNYFISLRNSSNESSFSTNYLTGLSYYLFYLRRMIQIIACFILFLLMPVFIALSAFYSIYYYSYAWTVSGVYLSGKISAIILFVFLFVLLCITVLLFRTFRFVTSSCFAKIKETRRLSSVALSITGGRKSLLSPSMLLRNDSSASVSRRSSTSTSLYSNSVPSPFWHIPSSRFFRNREHNNNINHLTATNDRPSSISPFHVNEVKTDAKQEGSTDEEEGLKEERNKSNASDKLATVRKKMIIDVIIFIFIASFDFMIMILADIFYVYVLLVYPTGVIISAELFLAIFKILLNNQFIWHSIPYLRRKAYSTCFPEEHSSSVDPRQSNVSSVSEMVSSSFYSHYYYSSIDISFITTMVLLNNILFPILAIFIVNPECFYNALFEASSISSSFSYNICDRTTEVDSACFQKVLFTEDTTYDPPYIYQYECASSVVVNYVPVFIIMFSMEGILLPFFKLLLGWLFVRNNPSIDDLLAAPSDQSMNFTNGTKNEVVDESDSEVTSNPSSNINATSRQTLDILISKQSLSALNDLNGKKTTSCLSIILSWLFHYILPDTLKNLTPSSPMKDDSRRCCIIFNKNRLTVRLNAYLVIMMTFGALFPPLAVIICVTIITITIYEEIVIGRLLYESERLGYGWYKKQLERDCYGMSESLKYTLWSLIPVSSFLYAYIIFDTWGDELGWKSALPSTFCMAFLPVLVAVILSTFLNYYFPFPTT
jgi:hypothetical protein